ncbi:hypothetical protein AWV79_37030 [Cupriavidus sp. UYMMa02A]|nr:hypothetical protein AWV79_37030 [Cupriavidus sp. UYMMa02A]
MRSRQPTTAHAVRVPSGAPTASESWQYALHGIQQRLLGTGAALLLPPPDKPVWPRQHRAGIGDVAQFAPGSIDIVRVAVGTTDADQETAPKRGTTGNAAERQ